MQAAIGDYSMQAEGPATQFTRSITHYTAATAAAANTGQYRVSPKAYQHEHTRKGTLNVPVN